MIGLLAMTAYNTGAAAIFLHALIPLPPLMWLADRANAAGDRLETARSNARRTKDYR